ncbi:tetratricopeptide repeat-containing sulfotransferase family protein [Pseudoxanthomonas wuyuanensis]|uniref:Tetratricopeptide repeat-containing protein n=1 Tax=Pseudoxanthomonas wuyuanensis TaxID=1073196 RepID=A0A286D496_9GAMM|nr:sulfotransferase [Pseudoxanthomonas wuyuanensis]KAF1717240.1 sulfotransferase [Pseudoxanthomonas wuyuanensis]SOD53477.1 Tetratricopeptide repeat-containing protein [Pseudoxanthomonas wuyuanensis]
MHPDIQQAIVALQQCRWEQAGALAARVLDSSPQDPDAHYIAGVSLLERNENLSALGHLKRAAALDGSRMEFRLLLARTHASLQDYGAALQEAERAMERVAPGDALAHDTLGVIFSQCHAHANALIAFQRAVGITPTNDGFRFNLGTTLTFFGRLEEAEHELEACLAINPHHWRAHHSLAQIRKQTIASNHIPRLSRLIAGVVGRVTATTYLNMALAKELEDIGEYEKAFNHYSIGKHTPKSLLGYSRERENALFNALACNFPWAEAALSPTGCSEEGPIFIVGMPRSGTTLVDRILSSHPLVHSAGELHCFPSAWKRALGGPGFEMFNPEHISKATDIDWERLGAAYLASTKPLVGSSPFFTDKLPHNFMYLGYIAMSLPNAKIVCVRRNPMDTCLSNFRQLFAPESPYFDYSYDLMDTGNYYILFDRLMAHWDQALPGRILQVRYESLVEEQEANIRKLLSHCNLPWDEACRRFEKNAAPVATASAVQVREGIYRSALGRWKRYGTQMDGLKQMLMDSGISCE